VQEKVILTISDILELVMGFTGWIIWIAMETKVIYLIARQIHLEKIIVT
jgi:hypothetical protein